MNCEDCKSKRCIDTTCRTCFPKEDKTMFDGLMNGDNVDFKPVRDFTDTKASEWPENDAYKTIDTINTSVDEIGSIIKDAKENDPELYNEIKSIVDNALIREGGE